MLGSISKWHDYAAKFKNSVKTDWDQGKKIPWHIIPLILGSRPFSHWPKTSQYDKFPIYVHYNWRFSNRAPVELNMRVWLFTLKLTSGNLHYDVMTTNRSHWVTQFGGQHWGHWPWNLQHDHDLCLLHLKPTLIWDDLDILPRSHYITSPLGL